MDYLSLSQLGGLIKSALSALDEDLWVAAEIARLNCQPSSGHCYLELVEKSDDKVIAQLKGTIWARVYGPLSANFLALTGRRLTPGMKILMLCRVSYHEIYGLSVNISAVDARYTLGEMALKKRETIERLTKEGIIDRNRLLEVPLVPQRIALISSETAAGYGDFMERMRNNPHGYYYDITLFQAYVQGDQAESSLVRALQDCARAIDRFDLAVIIRGGGSQVDLHVFDGYALAREIALFPIPVLTGIGHERDETVADRTAHRRLITPTAVAEFIIGRTRAFEETVAGMAGDLFSHTRTILEQSRSSLAETTHAFQTGAAAGLFSARGALKEQFLHVGRTSQLLLNRHTGTIAQHTLIASRQAAYFLDGRIKHLETMVEKIRLLDPLAVLRRGYSITHLNGKPLKDAAATAPGDIIETKLHRGNLISRVEKQA